VLRNSLARAAVLAGRTETAVRAIDESDRTRAELAHRFSLALAPAFAASCTRRVAISPRAERALESGAISREHSFVLMHGWASVFEGWALAELGDPDAGIPLMREGAARARTNGAGLFLPVLLGVLTEAQLKAGRAAESRATLAEALSLAARTGDQVSLSELDRLAGELCLVDDAGAASRAQAEQHFHVALERTRSGRPVARVEDRRESAALVARERQELGARASSIGLAPNAEATDLPGMVEARALRNPESSPNGWRREDKSPTKCLSARARSRRGWSRATPARDRSCRHADLRFPAPDPVAQVRSVAGNCSAGGAAGIGHPRLPVLPCNGAASHAWGVASFPTSSWILRD
jgi:hypothetical protein